MSRFKMHSGKDKRAFKRTATRTRAINVPGVSVPRGGTRL